MGTRLVLFHLQHLLCLNVLQWRGRKGVGSAFVGWVKDINTIIIIIIIILARINEWLN